MTIALDAVSASSAGTGTLSWTHTPVGTPRGVFVGIALDNTTADQVTGVTYGGVSMTEVALSPVAYAGVESVQVAEFFLGSSIPTGAQTVEVSVSGAANKIAYCVTATAAADTEIADTTSIAGLTANPSGTLSLGGASCFCVQAWSSGLNDPGAAPITDWTERYESDFGFRTSGLHTYDIVGTSDVTIGYTAVSDEVALLAVAIKEVAASGVTGTGSLTTSEATASGTGVISHTGTGSLTTSTTTASGTGTVTSGITGTGAIAVGAATASGAGTLAHTGTGVATVGAVTASGAGRLSHTGTGELTASSVTASATGTLSHTGTGAITVGNTTVSGTGVLGTGVTGTGAITIGNVTVSGTGTRIGWDVVSDASGSWSDVAANADGWSIVANASGSWTVQ